MTESDITSIIVNEIVENDMYMDVLEDNDDKCKYGVESFKTL